MLERIPIMENSNMPCMRKAFHPSSLWSVWEGAWLVVHTSESSSSVFPTKQNSSVKSTRDKSFSLHIETS